MFEILGTIFNTILYQPLLNLLIVFYNMFGKELGFAIIAMTVFIKLVTFPLSRPSIHFAKKQKELAPELNKLKEKYKDKKVFAQKQMELYKEHGLNPAAGCLPIIVQLIVFGFLYRVFTDLLGANGLVSEKVFSMLYEFPLTTIQFTETLKTSFLMFNLAAVDRTYVLPVLSGLSQFALSKYMAKVNKPGSEVAKTTPDTKDDIMYNVQEATTYTLPVMTFFIGISLPAGLSLYWLFSTLLTFLQYWMMNSDILKYIFKKNEPRTTTN